MDFNVEQFEKNLHMTFNNKEHLITALTHSSYANQFRDIKYNERLEFLGDSVLQLCITQYLFNYFTNKSEGELTKIRALIVCENSLCEVGKKLNLGAMIRMSKGEELTGGRERTSIQADCVEAVIAAIYLDKGIDVVNKFIIDNFQDVIKKAINEEIVLDFKTRLQEIMQRNGEVNIIYEMIKHEGPPHRRKFFTRVLIDNIIMGEGNGYSKKEAEQNAAKHALSKMEEVR